MSPKVTHWLLLAFVIVLSIFALTRNRSVAPERAERAQAVSALEIVPPGAAFLLSVDVPKLQSSKVAELLGALESSLISDVQTVCGFDPLRLLEEAVLAVPSSGALANSEQDFALVARGDFSATTISACANKLIERRGGSAVETQIGAFRTVRDRRRPAGEIAISKRWLIVGGGNYLRELLDRAEGHIEHSAAANAFDTLHAALRAKFPPRTPIIATSVLPPGFFERKFGKAEVQGSPLLELRAAALGIELGERVVLEGFLGCANPKACVDLEIFARDVTQLLFAGDSAAQAKNGILIKRSGSEIRLRTELTYPRALDLFRKAASELK